MVEHEKMLVENKFRKTVDFVKYLEKTVADQSSMTLLQASESMLADRCRRP